MEVPVYSKEGVELPEQVQLNEAVFDREPSAHILYQAVQAQQAHERQGTHSTKNRAKVRGGGSKPYRQKGTGRARAGTSRSPLWQGGGRIFGPSPHPYAYKLQKKVKRLARISALSHLARSGCVKVIEDFDIEAPKTKEMFAILESMQLTGAKTLFVTEKTTRGLFLSCRNIPNVIVREYKDLSTYDILNCSCMVIQKSAVEGLNKIGVYERFNESH